MELTKRQKEIINASIDLIATGGIQNFTMKSLSRDIGISEPAIYRHFDSKLDILMAILTSIRNDIQSFEKKNNIENNGTLEDINRMFCFQIESFVKNPSLASILFSEEIFQNELKLSNNVKSIMNDTCDLVEKVILREQKKGNVTCDINSQVLTNIIIGTIRLIVIKWKLAGCKNDLKKIYTMHWNSLNSLLKM
ncbi:MAG: TetR/AcrR family transcriptional regulator [Sphaerochaetaceae bacterium]|nr:TetR/AcrR family transcriptional regulator [Sphaerochaetaceae bacterium]